MTMYVPQEFAGATRGGRQVLLKFKKGEFDTRLAATRRRMRERGLDALIVFSQESHYWLTSYDTAGYVFFQAGLVLADDGTAPPTNPVVGPRIGISRAMDFPWRWHVADHLHVSVNPRRR